MTASSTVPTRLVASVGALLLAGALAACSSDGGTATGAHEVRADDDSCRVDATSLDAGKNVFKVENVGSDVTEVYVYGKDGDAFSKIMGERENIGPGTSQTLEVDLAAGQYELACKPGMRGDGIRTTLTVAGSGGSAEAAKESYDRELELEVQSDGRVEPPSKLAASAGEKVELKLENQSKDEYYVELLGPDGSELGEAEAHGGETAEFVAKLADAGDYRVKVFQDGREAKATTMTLTVAD